LKILSGVTPFVVAIGGILLYVSQLRWSKKFIAAKDEIIKLKDAEIATVRAQAGAVSITKDETIKEKDAEIANLKTHISNLASNHAELIKTKEGLIIILEREIKSLQDFNSMKLKEYFITTKVMLEEYNNSLQKQFTETKNAIEMKRQRFNAASV
jgi:hypothetical protein